MESLEVGMTGLAEQQVTCRSLGERGQTPAPRTCAPTVAASTRCGVSTKRMRLFTTARAVLRSLHLRPTIKVLPKQIAWRSGGVGAPHRYELARRHLYDLYRRGIAVARGIARQLARCAAVVGG
jgi:hypothetical protein